MFLGYNTSKAAVIRMAQTLQREMEVNELDDVIQIYALHPGGVLTAMGGGKSSLRFLQTRINYCGSWRSC